MDSPSCMSAVGHSLQDLAISKTTPQSTPRGGGAPAPTAPERRGGFDAAAMATLFLRRPTAGEAAAAEVVAAGGPARATQPVPHGAPMPGVPWPRAGLVPAAPPHAGMVHDYMRGSQGWAPAVGGGAPGPQPRPFQGHVGAEVGDTASEAARGAGTPPTALTQRWAAGRGAHLTPGTSPAKSSFPWTLASSIKANGAQSALTSPPTVTGPLSGAAGYQARNATGAARPGSPTPRPSTAALPWPYGGDIFEESHATLSPIVPGVGEEEPFLGHLGMGMGLRVRRTINFAEAAESGITRSANREPSFREMTEERSVPQPATAAAHRHYVTGPYNTAPCAGHGIPAWGYGVPQGYDLSRGIPVGGYFVDYGSLGAAPRPLFQQPRRGSPSLAATGEPITPSLSPTSKHALEAGGVFAKSPDSAAAAGQAREPAGTRQSRRLTAKAAARMGYFAEMTEGDGVEGSGNDGEGSPEGLARKPARGSAEVAGAHDPHTVGERSKPRAQKVGSSVFRGVTRHRWTGRWEAHLWDSAAVRKGSKTGRSRGRQIYLGGYDSEFNASKAYDRASIVWWGKSAVLNHPVEDNDIEMEALQCFSRDEIITLLRGKTHGWSLSQYRGVIQHPDAGWEARIYHGRPTKLGFFASEEAAAHAYDRAAMVYRGPFAVTNFPVTNYLGEAAATFQATGSLPEGFGIVRGSSRAVGSAAPAAEPRQTKASRKRKAPERPGPTESAREGTGAGRAAEASGSADATKPGDGGGVNDGGHKQQVGHGVQQVDSFRQVPEGPVNPGSGGGGALSRAFTLLARADTSRGGVRECSRTGDSGDASGIGEWDSSGTEESGEWDAGGGRGAPRSKTCHD